MYKVQKVKQSALYSICSQLLQSADLYAQQVQLRINKNEKFSSPLGIVLSLGILATCIILALNNISDVINQNNPSVVQTDQQQPETPVIVLSPKNFTFTIAVTNSAFVDINGLGTLFQLVFQNCYRVRNTTTKISTNGCFNYRVDYCSNSSYPSEYQQTYFKNFNYNATYCINSDDWNNRSILIQGNAGSNTWQYFQMFLIQCKNSTTNQKCQPQSVINQKMAGGYYAVYMQNDLLNLKQAGQPFNPNIRSTSQTFSINATKQLVSQYKIINVQTDRGLFFEDFEYASDIVSEQDYSDYNPTDGTGLIYHGVQTQVRFSEYIRTYQKIQTVVGIIGGLWQAMYFGVLLLVMPFMQQMMQLSLINKFFTFDYKTDKLSQHSMSVHRSKVKMNQSGSNSPINSHKGETKQLAKSGTTKFNIRNITDKKEIARYLKFKKNELQLGLGDICSMFIGKRKKEKIQFEYSMQKILQKMDVTYIIEKLFEIDKLKMVLLSPQQIQLFNYFPKPCIPEFIFDDTKSQQTLRQDESKPQYAHILKEEQTQQSKVEEAYKAYKKLRTEQTIQQNSIDQRIMDSLDEDIIQLFEYLIEIDDQEQKPKTIDVRSMTFVAGEQESVDEHVESYLEEHPVAIPQAPRKF